MMKKVKIGLLAFLITVLSFSVFSWHNRKLMTPAQETAIFSLANRFIESGCRRPSDLAEIFEGSIIPTSLLNKSKEFLSEQLMVEGECFGRPMAEIQENTLYEIEHLPRKLIRLNMTSEIAVGDFLDCLVEVEKSFYSLQIATRKIFTCIERHLDVRGFWYEMIDEIKPRDIVPPPTNHYTPSLHLEECMENCYSHSINEDLLDQCQNDCSLHYSDVIYPMPAPPVPVYDMQPMPVEPTDDIKTGAIPSSTTKR